MSYLWWKAWHIIAMVAWMSGLFYCPRLFVYHSQCPDDDHLGQERLLTMERRLYYGIMWPAALCTTGFGLALMVQGWEMFRHDLNLHLKLGLVLLLWGHHLACGHYYRAFRTGCNRHHHVFYRWFNEIPTLILIPVVILIVVKPLS